MPSILFVCTANICRSPMAMGLFKARLKDDGREWRVESAGTWAMDGAPAAENTQKVVARRGVDISEHRSRIVSGELLEQFDLILAMEQHQKEALQVEFPEVKDRVYLLSEMVDGIYDIKDPIGGRLSEFEDTAEEVDLIFDRGFEKIRDLTKEERRRKKSR
jgi:protein-tyrosine-phosphatase